MKGYPTLYNGILFLESDVPMMRGVKRVEVDLSFVLGAQLKNLNDVKCALAAQAQNMACNCIANFKYGQKSRWLAMDDVAFFGSGIAGILPETEFAKYIDYIAQRDNA